MSMNFLKKERWSSDFNDKLNALISFSAGWLCPEDKASDTPRFDKAVLYNTNFFSRASVRRKLFRRLKKYFDLKKLEETYEFMSDEYSKEILLRLIVYKLNSQVRLRLPIYYAYELARKNDFEKLLLSDDEIVLWGGMLHLKKYDLSKIGFDLKLWFSSEGLIVDFIREQYRYRDIVSVNEGDYVIDAGACYGDTALYFSCQNKGKGKVYSFEFMPENLEIFEKNLQLNPEYADNIVLVKKAISDKTGEKVNFVLDGPGTSVSRLGNDDGALSVDTITIDDCVAAEKISKVDFIKMDIEGSEVPALKGAVETIRKFKPKLAICGYHKEDDLWTIPQLIKSILPEYRLYIDHHTCMNNETVIYAIV